MLLVLDEVKMQGAIGVEVSARIFDYILSIYVSQSPRCPSRIFFCPRIIHLRPATARHDAKRN